MKYIKFCIVSLVVCCMNMLSLHGMFSKLTSKSAAMKRAATLRSAQRRTLYSPERLKGLHAPLTLKAQEVSPVHGAIEFGTETILNRYAVESQAFGPQLVQELFFRQDSQFRPTSSKSKAGYSLSPEILGLVIGALETGKLQEAKIRDYIIHQWQKEYRKITDDKKSFPRGKIEKLLTLIENEYNNDKDSCRRILLGFLYAKALPDNDHDMIHYLAGLNEFMEVFTDQSSASAQSVQAYKSGLSSSSLSSPVYTQKDYDELRGALQKADRPQAVEHVIAKNFELAVSAMLNKNQGASLYPPKVVQSSYGYKGKENGSDCVETTIRDLLNIILYNQQSQSFDLSLLPSTLTLNENFKEFYTKNYDISRINTKECGQDFMNLVSGIDGVVYKRRDYELAAAESGKNLLTVMNYFFGINAQSLSELGAKISNKTRIITFTEPTYAYDTSSMKITMSIKDQQTNNLLQADFCFREGHGWAEVSERDRQGISQSFFTPEELAQNYRINSDVKSLLRIEPRGFLFLPQDSPPEQLSKSFYYTFPVEEDHDKVKVIRQIKKMGADNIDREAFDYVFYLYEQLPSYYQIDLMPDILTMAIEAIERGKWHSNVKCKKFIINNYSLVLKKIRSKKEYANFVKELYKELPDELSKYKLIMDALEEIINTKILDTDLVAMLYEQIADNKYKQNFLADFLLIFAKNRIWADKIDCVAIAKRCINDGADVNIFNGRQETPLDVLNKDKKTFHDDDILEKLREILLAAGAKTSAQLLKEQLKDLNDKNSQEQSNRE